MTKNELQLQHLFINNIALDYFPMDTIEALCVNINNEKRICLNSNRERSSITEFWIIEHELAHLETDALYTINSKSKYIDKMERKANDNMILKFGLPDKVLKCLKYGLTKYEISEQLEITYEVIDSCIDYLYRKGLIPNNEFN
ncbi:MAG: hypothetical protein K6G28_00665 [Acholeplasmatales bacterium]|nr:hypothetical protein [Acholeplasmatales bacterium]